MKIERRNILKRIGAPFFVSLASTVGLLKHSVSYSADLNKSLFKSRDLNKVLSGVIGVDAPWGRAIPNRKITISLPEIAENHHAIPVEVTSSIENTTRITLICEQGDFPLVAEFKLSNGAQSFISTRFRLEPSTCTILTVRAIVHTAEGGVYSAVNEAYLTYADCGGG